MRIDTKHAVNACNSLHLELRQGPCTCANPPGNAWVIKCMWATPAQDISEKLMDRQTRKRFILLPWEVQVEGKVRAGGDSSGVHPSSHEEAVADVNREACAFRNGARHDRTGRRRELRVCPNSPANLRRPRSLCKVQPPTSRDACTTTRTCMYLAQAQPLHLHAVASPGQDKGGESSADLAIWSRQARAGLRVLGKR